MRPLIYLAPLSFLAMTAHAEDRTFLELTRTDDSKVVGQSTTTPFENWIEVDALRWKVTADSSWTKAGGASVGKPQIGKLEWRQALEPSANDLLRVITKGTSYKSAEFQVAATTSAPGSLAPFFKVKAGDMFMTNVAVSGFAHVDAESVFKSIDLVHTVRGKNGSPIGSTSLAFNTESNLATVKGSSAPLIQTTITGRSPAADGETHAYLRLDSSMAGASLADGYQNWIELENFSYSVTAESSFSKGGGASVAKPQPGALVWSQMLDPTLPLTLGKILSGQSLPELVIELVKQDADAEPVTFAQLVFKNSFFTEVALDSGLVNESVVFKELYQTVFALDPRGGLGSGSTFHWSVPDGKAEILQAQNQRAALKGFGDGMLGWSTSDKMFALPSSSVSPPEAPATVPLPATWPLFAVGMALLARRRRRGASAG